MLQQPYPKYWWMTHFPPCSSTPNWMHVWVVMQTLEWSLITWKMCSFLRQRTICDRTQQWKPSESNPVSLYNQNQVDISSVFSTAIRYKLSRTLLSQKPFGLLGKRDAVTADYMPTLRFMCRLQKSQQQKDEPDGWEWHRYGVTSSSNHKILRKTVQVCLAGHFRQFSVTADGSVEAV